MRKAVTIEDTFCDECGKRGYVRTCLNCPAEFCWDCQKARGVEYPPGVHWSGTGDAFYCVACDVALSNNGDERHAAYRRIIELRREAANFWDGAKVRATRAEATLKAIQDALGQRP